MAPKTKKQKGAPSLVEKPEQEYDGLKFVSFTAQRNMLNPL